LFPRLLIALLILAAIFLLLRWFIKTPPKQVVRVARRTGVGAGIALLAYLGATGRLSWLFALIAAIVAAVYRVTHLAGLFPLIQRWLHTQGSAEGAGSASSTGQSRVRTTYLRMVLEHATGLMRGEVLAGRFKGARLETLTLEQLLALLEECYNHDQASAALLEAYLDRVHGDQWRAQAGAERREAGSVGGDGRMTRQEAYDILGLATGASVQEIIEAHRRLIQKLHPDRGGSTYLAAKLNQAKDLLLGKQR
jgi:proline dehydrogenase